VALLCCKFLRSSQTAGLRCYARGKANRLLLLSQLTMITLLLLTSALLSPAAHAFSAQPNSPQHPQRVIIVGAGVGGLATAARIKSTLPSTTDVLILEKNGRDQLGGRCGSFDVSSSVDNIDGAFRHERGPSLLLLKEEYERLFEDCGKRAITAISDGGGTTRATTAAEAYGLQMKQCIPAYQVVFDDGDAISVGFPRSKCNSGLSLEEIKEIQILEQESIAKLNQLESDGYEKWQNYLHTCAAFLDCGLPNFIEERLDVTTLPAFMVEALKDGAKRWPLQPHSAMLDALFDSPKLKAMASFQDLYVGLEPYNNEQQLGGGVLRKTAPAVFGLLAALELHPTNNKAGVFAPVGGFRQVAESMYELCLDNDVDVKFDTSVTRITNDGVHFTSKDDDKVGFLPADLVICNADVPFATETILSASSNDGNNYDWNDKFDYSSGVIAFHWSFAQQIEALNTHNVFMSAKNTEDAVSSWSVLRDGDDSKSINKSLKDQPFNFYVHRASHTDETAAPPGCDSIMVLVPCKPLVRMTELASLPREEAILKYKQQFDEDLVNDVREAVMERLSVLQGLENLQDILIDEVIDTPGTYADYYNVGGGVPFGLSHGLGQLSLTRPGAEPSTHDNVLFVGASSRPGNGVPLVLIGAKLVAKRAIKKLQRKGSNIQ
ncbi:phytoene desaturase family protein, partial [Skeletonema marinoi]